MSAPRKIWADMDLHDVHGRAVGGDWWNAPSTGILYHHDDVVRELVAAAQRLVGHEQWGTFKYTDDGMWADGEALRAALAKIAQDA